jgi:putative methionine-R-sulfoxide reductase with GAF domain
MKSRASRKTAVKKKVVKKKTTKRNPLKKVRPAAPAVRRPAARSAGGGPDGLALARLGELSEEVSALRAQSRLHQRRADHLAMLNSVIHRVASILESDALMQEAARAIQEKMNYNSVAVTVLDTDGVLIGRWAGREGVSRQSAGRAQAPAAGIIGRAVRKRAPQVVSDVRRDPDYRRDVLDTRSEMVVPLMDGGEVVGAIDVQSDQIDDFGLDDVATGETIAEFLVVALRNARLVDELRRQPGQISLDRGTPAS